MSIDQVGIFGMSAVGAHMVKHTLSAGGGGGLEGPFLASQAPTTLAWGTGLSSRDINRQ